MPPLNEGSEYRQKKAFFDRYLTLYGRNTVLEALRSPAVECYRLHLAESNRPAPVLSEIASLAEAKGAEIVHHGKRELSRISRNSRQDQGVAADIRWDGYMSVDALTDTVVDPSLQLLALDRIHNPQNLGMIVRSTVAGRIDGLVVPSQGGCGINPLVAKSSVGTLFKSRIIHCGSLQQALGDLRQHDFEICILTSTAGESLFTYNSKKPSVYVLGNEAEGVSVQVRRLATRQLRIPMHNGVDSLNVAVSAALVAFRQQLAAPLAERR